MKEKPIAVNLTPEERQKLIIEAHVSAGLVKKPKTALEVLAEANANNGNDSS